MNSTIIIKVSRVSHTSINLSWLGALWAPINLRPSSSAGASGLSGGGGGGGGGAAAAAATAAGGRGGEVGGKFIQEEKQTSHTFGVRRTPFQILSIVLNNHLLVQLLWSLARKVFSDGLCFVPWVIATSLFLDCNLGFPCQFVHWIFSMSYKHFYVCIKNIRVLSSMLSIHSVLQHISFIFPRVPLPPRTAFVQVLQ